MNTPSYYAVIPAFVRYSNIMANAKLLYGEITALSDKTGYCFASNTYFASLYGVDIKQITRWIQDLRDAGFVSVEIDQENGNKRLISIVQPMDEKVPTLGTKKSRPSGRKSPDPRDEKVPYNNTINNTINDIIIITEEEEKKEEVLEKINDEEMIDNIDDLRRFLNKGRLMDDYFYKIGDEDSFERVTSDFFIFCDDNQRKMKKKTIEAKFRAYLKPKWETEEDIKIMKDNFRRRKEKVSYTMETKEEDIEEIKNRREKEEQKVREIEENLPSERLLELQEEAKKQVRDFLGSKIINQTALDFLIK